jgi:hypothetical protein
MLKKLTPQYLIKLVFQIIPSPEDSHIYRKARKNVLRVQRTRTFIGALTNVRVRWTRGNCSFAFSINVQVLWTC